MTDRLKQLTEIVTDFFFPRQCIGCGKVGDFICDQCSKKLPRLLPPICQKCGKPESSGIYCQACWKKQDGIDAIRSVFIFNGMIRTAVHELKYRNLRAIAAPLAGHMADYANENIISGDIVVPVPLHIKRLRQRGYNQSELLAIEFAGIVKLPISNCLSRTRDSQPQVRTSNANMRRENVKNAFSCANKEIIDRHVILIDDVCTSGATLEACTVALKQAGVKNVVGFTLAREI
ncbi:MAG: ComF family protein [Dehalococcoidia bacterium]|nr:ComF family protein [Dehalococcoidia bacterium]MDD5495001.1 ComF family protein [Dehalococcoidia bacterium]